MSVRSAQSQITASSVIAAGNPIISSGIAQTELLPSSPTPQTSSSCRKASTMACPLTQACPSKAHATNVGAPATLPSFACLTQPRTRQKSIDHRTHATHVAKPVMRSGSARMGKSATIVARWAIRARAASKHRSRCVTNVRARVILK